MGVRLPRVTTTVLGVPLVSGTMSATGPDVERRFLVAPPVGMSFDSVNVSPDGRHLAFTAAPGHAKTKLSIRALDSLEARELPDTDDASLPFWSPASDALGFFAAGHLWTVTVAGAPRNASLLRRKAAAERGIVTADPLRARLRGVLSRVDAGGGAATPVTTLAHGERGHVWPEFLPMEGTFCFCQPSRPQRPQGIPRVCLAARRKLAPAMCSTTESGVLNSADGYLYSSARVSCSRNVTTCSNSSRRENRWPWRAGGWKTLSSP